MKAETLQAIIKFADQAHGNQLRKYTGERYIVHPIRVMQTCQQYSHDPALLAGALLHDVLEDTPVSKDEIKEFLLRHLDEVQTRRAMQYIEELTDIFVRKNYPRMNRRQRKEKEASRLAHVSPEAQTIKYADIMDNATDIVLHDREFGYVYLREAEMILDKMKHGHRILFERALHTVKECMERVWKVEKIE
jgi:guanosine-3',5'-bis(diphosphate) 3'-pyrophosphohydrolase